MPAFHDRVKVATPTVGTGQLTLGNPAVGYQSLAAAGVVDGQTIGYLIEDGADVEVGTGVSTSAGTLLTRNVSFSTNANAPLNLSGAAVVSVPMTAALTSRPSKTTVFTSSGTWAKEEGCKAVQVVLIGGGAGGGSGRKGAAGTARSGGGGGGGGGFTTLPIEASLLGATETVTVATSASGGAARGSDSTNGQPGATGNNSSFGAHAFARGGLASAAAAAGNVTGGAGGLGGLTGGAGNGTQVGGGVPGAPAVASLSATGGGSGGSISNGNSPVSPSVSGAKTGANNKTATAIETNGASVAGGYPEGGMGGGGGSSSTSGDASAGGDGGLYGGGGGGGGAAVDGVGSSGAGGAGAAGLCVVVEYF